MGAVMAGDIIPTTVLTGAQPNVPNRPAPAVGDAASGRNAGQETQPRVKDTVSVSTQGVQRAHRVSGTQNSNQPILIAGATQKIRSFTETNRLVTKVVDPSSQEVVRQIPSAGEVQLKEAIHKLVADNHSGD